MLFAWMAACAPEWAEPASTPADLEAQLDQMVEDHTRRFGYEPAITLAVVADQVEVARHVSGDREPASGDAVTSAAPMPMASATKVLTALMVMQQVERGAFDLDDPIGDLVPDLPGSVRSITIEALLTHTDGLADGHESPVMAELSPAEREAFGLRDYVDLALTLEPHFDPGDKDRYSQTGFVLLALAVEQAAGVPYEQHLHESLLEPLGMASTGWANGYTALGDYTPLVYERAGDGFAALEPAGYTRADIATAGLVSTLDDLVTLQLALQAGGLVDRDTLIRIMEDAPPKGDWGLGWERRDVRGYPISGHSGGQSAVFAMSPDGRGGAVFLTDTADGQLLDLGYEIGFKAAQWVDLH